MKIIKLGDKWWIGKQSTCYYCGSTIELEEKDEVKISTFAENKGRAIYFNCPACGGHMWINEEPKDETPKPDPN